MNTGNIFVNPSKVQSPSKSKNLPTNILYQSCFSTSRMFKSSKNDIKTKYKNGNYKTKLQKSDGTEDFIRNLIKYESFSPKNFFGKTTSLNKVKNSKNRPYNMNVIPEKLPELIRNSKKLLNSNNNIKKQKENNSNNNNEEIIEIENKYKQLLKEKDKVILQLQGEISCYKTFIKDLNVTNNNNTINFDIINHNQNQKNNFKINQSINNHVNRRIMSTIDENYATNLNSIGNKIKPIKCFRQKNNLNLNLDVLDYNNDPNIYINLPPNNDNINNNSNNYFTIDRTNYLNNKKFNTIMNVNNSNHNINNLKLNSFQQTINGNHNNNFTLSKYKEEIKEINNNNKTITTNNNNNYPFTHKNPPQILNPNLITNSVNYDTNFSIDNITNKEKNRINFLTNNNSNSNSIYAERLISNTPNSRSFFPKSTQLNNYNLNTTNRKKQYNYLPNGLNDYVKINNNNGNNNFEIRNTEKREGENQNLFEQPFNKINISLKKIKLNNLKGVNNYLGRKNFINSNNGSNNIYPGTDYTQGSNFYRNNKNLKTLDSIESNISSSNNNNNIDSKEKNKGNNDNNNERMKIVQQNFDGLKDRVDNLINGLFEIIKSQAQSQAKK